MTFFGMYPCQALLLANRLLCLAPGGEDGPSFSPAMGCIRRKGHLYRDFAGLMKIWRRGIVISCSSSLSEETWSIRLGADREWNADGATVGH